jgi:hypothetical protein
VNTFNRIVVVLLAIAALIVAASIGINGGPTTGPILPVLTRLVSISPDGLIPAAAFIAAVALLILFIELRASTRLSFAARSMVLQSTMTPAQSAGCWRASFRDSMT